MGLLGQHILEVRSAENDEENQKIILPEFAEFFSEVRSAEKENENGILKMENEYDTKTFGEKLFYEVENTYACLTWEARRKSPAEQKTHQQAVQRAVQFPAQLRNSN